MQEADIDAWLEYADAAPQNAENEPRGLSPRHLAITVVIGAGAIVIGLFVLWPSGAFRDSANELEGLLSAESYEAEIVTIARGPCEGCIDVTFSLIEGPDAGLTTVSTFAEGPMASFEPGDRVVMAYYPDAEPGFQYEFADRQRRGVLILIAAVFAIAVVLLGRLRGLAALAGLAVSVAVMFWFVIPAILDGRPPVIVAVVGAGAIAYVALFLAHGFTTLTLVALVGTLSALALTAGLSAVTVGLAEITGLATEESTYLTLFSQNLDFQGLVLAGIVLGALGALDDVTVTQASAVRELRRTSPDESPRSLYRSGMRVGRDHIVSTVNTLLLAYAGAALPLLVLFVIAQQSLGSIANSEAIAIEMIRTMVGSIGLVAAVPATTWLAARVSASRGAA